MKFPQNFLAGAGVLTAGAGGEMTEFAQLYQGCFSFTRFSNVRTCM